MLGAQTKNNNSYRLEETGQNSPRRWHVHWVFTTGEGPEGQGWKGDGKLEHEGGGLER